MRLPLCARTCCLSISILFLSLSLSRMKSGPPLAEFLLQFGCSVLFYSNLLECISYLIQNPSEKKCRNEKCPKSRWTSERCDFTCGGRSLRVCGEKKPRVSTLSRDIGLICIRERYVSRCKVQKIEISIRVLERLFFRVILPRVFCRLPMQSTEKFDNRPQSNVAYTVNTPM